MRTSDCLSLTGSHTQTCPNWQPYTNLLLGMIKFKVLTWQKFSLAEVWVSQFKLAPIHISDVTTTVYEFTLFALDSQLIALQSHEEQASTRLCSLLGVSLYGVHWFKGVRKRVPKCQSILIGTVWFYKVSGSTFCWVCCQGSPIWK